MTLILPAVLGLPSHAQPRLAVPSPAMPGLAMPRMATAMPRPDNMVCTNCKSAQP